MVSVYDIGDTARLGNPVLGVGSAAFTDGAGVARDPTTVALVVTSPSGVVTTYSYPTGTLLLTRESVGRYFSDVVLTEGNGWTYTLTGLGIGAGVNLITSSSGSGVVWAGAVPLTLAQLEQEVARRVGPYYADAAAAGSAASPATLVCSNLTSSIDLGGYEDLWLLRRGRTSAGVAISGFVAGDRQRRVKDYDPATGVLSLDRAYAVAPIAGEAFELHHLDPANELRPAVVAGLWRCYLVDRAPATVLTYAAERNLTSVAPWITSPEQVLGVAYTSAGSTERPIPVWWRRVFATGGGVWLSLAGDPAPATLLVTSRRPAATLINGAVSTTGPTSDDDILAVDRLYAAAAGHVECWRMWRDRLQDAAAEGRRLTLEGAAAEFSGQAQRWYRPPPHSEEFEEPWGPGGAAVGRLSLLG